MYFPWTEAGETMSPSCPSKNSFTANSRLSFSDLVYDRKRQDASILVTTSIAMIIAEIVSCQAKVHDEKKREEPILKKH